MKRERDTHLAEGLEVVGEYALDQLEIKVLWRHSCGRNCGRSPLPNRRGSPKIASASWAVGPSSFVVPFGRVIDPSSFASSMRRSSPTTLSTTIMTDWRSVTTAVDDTTAVQGSCGLKPRRRTYPLVKEEKRKHRTKTRTSASSLS